jgi:hypothetical protein
MTKPKMIGPTTVTKDQSTILSGYAGGEGITRCPTLKTLRGEFRRHLSFRDAISLQVDP